MSDSRTTTLTLRTTERAKSAVRRAAEYRGMSVSEYGDRMLRRAAVEDIARAVGVEDPSPVRTRSSHEQVDGRPR